MVPTAATYGQHLGRWSGHKEKSPYRKLLKSCDRATMGIISRPRQTEWALLKRQVWQIARYRLRIGSNQTGPTCEIRPSFVWRPDSRLHLMRKEGVGSAAADKCKVRFNSRFIFLSIAIALAHPGCLASKPTPKQMGIAPRLREGDKSVSAGLAKKTLDLFALPWLSA